MTFDPNVLDLSKNEPLKDNRRVNLHPPTKFDGDQTKNLGAVEEQTERQTNSLSNYNMIPCIKKKKSSNFL